MARPLRGEPAGPWRRLRHLCRELAPALPPRGDGHEATGTRRTGTTRSFRARCGTPLAYERARSAHMVNVPCALFAGRTGREPHYHIAIDQLQDWTCLGEKLVPLKGFPGVVWDRPGGRRRVKMRPVG